MLVIEDKSEK